jgi:hypothetical protein
MGNTVYEASRSGSFPTSVYSNTIPTAFFFFFFFKLTRGNAEHCLQPKNGAVVDKAINDEATQPHRRMSITSSRLHSPLVLTVDEYCGPDRRSQVQGAYESTSACLNFCPSGLHLFITSVRIVGGSSGSAENNSARRGGGIEQGLR